MKPLWLCLVLVMTLACERPEMEAFRKRPAPLVVTLNAPAGVGHDVEQEYAAAIRAKVANLTTVVPEGVSSPVGAAHLKVTLFDRSHRSRFSPGAVGAATGVAVGMLSAMAGNRDAWFDGLFWGLFVGTQAAAAKRMELERLGYQPPRIEAQVEILDGVSNESVLVFPVNPEEVVEELRPLRDRHDELVRREEEAKAFATVIAHKLQERLQWLPLASPSWYGGEERR